MGYSVLASFETSQNLKTQRYGFRTVTQLIGFETCEIKFLSENLLFFLGFDVKPNKNIRLLGFRWSKT